MDSVADAFLSLVEECGSGAALAVYPGGPPFIIPDLQLPLVLCTAGGTALHRVAGAAPGRAQLLPLPAGGAQGGSHPAPRPRRRPRRLPRLSPLQTCRLSFWLHLLKKIFILIRDNTI